MLAFGTLFSCQGAQAPHQLSQCQKGRRSEISTHLQITKTPGQRASSAHRTGGLAWLTTPGQNVDSN